MTTFSTNFMNCVGNNFTNFLNTIFFQPMDTSKGKKRREREREKKKDFTQI